MKDKLDFPSFTITLLRDRVVHLAFKKVKELDLSDSQDIVTGLKMLGGGKRMSVIISFQGFIRPNEEMMTETNRKEIMKYVSGSAFIVKSLALRLGIKFFMNFYGDKDGIPRNIFETKEKAVEWLNKIQDKTTQKVLAVEA